jgi:adenosylcobinamide-GDP ribazoletransferase
MTWQVLKVRALVMYKILHKYSHKNMITPQYWKQQLHIFLNALMFYTRIPVPKWMHHDEEMLNKATIYFPVIGWIVGGISALTFYIFSFAFNPEIAILLSMIVSVLTTGAFHEDGFADVCDGFGGGWAKEKILEIMKDSRVGTYGAVGLILILGIKFFSLEILDNQTLICSLVIAHSLSRFVALSLIFTLDYVREDALSKVKPIAKKLSQNDLWTAFTFAVIPFFLYVIITKNFFLFLVFPPLILWHLYAGYFFKKWIGGYTGDCLGATQQVAEVIIYLVIVAIST